MDSILSFVGKSFAKVGFRFYFQGVNPNCPKSCSFYATCQTNLEPNTVYEIAEVKSRTLQCPKGFHQEQMQLVRLEKPEIKASMYNKDIYEGSIINFSPVTCERVDCTYYEYCEPQSLLLHKGERVKTVEKLKKITDCPKGLYLSIVRLEKKES